MEEYQISDEEYRTLTLKEIYLDFVRTMDLSDPKQIERADKLRRF